MLNNSLGNWFTLNELGFLSAFCPSRTRSSNPRSEALFFSNLCTVTNSAYEKQQGNPAHHGRPFL